MLACLATVRQTVFLMAFDIFDTLIQSLLKQCHHTSSRVHSRKHNGYHCEAMNLHVTMKVQFHLNNSLSTQFIGLI